MDDLSDLVGSLNQSELAQIVRHDAHILLHCHLESIASNVYCCVPFNLCKMRKRLYPTTHLLYADLLTEFKRMGHGSEVIELMPYVDDYLCHFD
jgi:hypothetical protein